MLIDLTNNLNKRDAIPNILKAAALETIHSWYSENELLHVYIDGSFIDKNEDTAGIHHSLFLMYPPVGRDWAPFNYKIRATCPENFMDCPETVVTSNNKLF